MSKKRVIVNATRPPFIAAVLFTRSQGTGIRANASPRGPRHPDQATRQPASPTLTPNRPTRALTSCEWPAQPIMALFGGDHVSRPLWLRR